MHRRWLFQQQNESCATKIFSFIQHLKPLTAVDFSKIKKKTCKLVTWLLTFSDTNESVEGWYTRFISPLSGCGGGFRRRKTTGRHVGTGAACGSTALYSKRSFSGRDDGAKSDSLRGASAIVESCRRSGGSGTQCGPRFGPGAGTAPSRR